MSFILTCVEKRFGLVPSDVMLNDYTLSSSFKKKDYFFTPDGLGSLWEKVPPVSVSPTS